MRAMILAAGRGRRMLELTKKIPKPLIKIGGIALIEYSINALKSAAITDIVINIAYLAKSIKNYLGDGTKFGINISYSHELNTLETAGGIIKALHLLNDEPFIVTNADILHNYNLNNLKLPSNSLAHLVLVDNPIHNANGDFSLQNNQQVATTMPKNYTFSGIGIYHPDIFKPFLQKQQKLKLTVIFKKAITDKCLTGEYFNGYWQDVGNLQSLQLAHKNYHNIVK